MHRTRTLARALEEASLSDGGGKRHDMRAGVVLEDRFELTHVLGSGGFGDVWAAHDRLRLSSVALKIIPQARTQHPWQKSLVLAETQALSKLSHPHIVRLHESLVTQDRVIMVMEHVDGSTLASEIGARARTERHFTAHEVRAIATRLVTAIEEAHRAGILHRDLKPGNVMILPDEPYLKLLDFGIARLADQMTSEATTAGRQMGTMSQLAPEIVRGEEVDHRVDVFGLGCVVFELLTLRHPWIVDAKGHAQRGPRGGLATPRDWRVTFERIVRGPRPQVTTYTTTYSSALNTVIARALASRPDERYGSVTELLQALDEALDRRPSSPMLETTPVAIPWISDLVPAEDLGWPASRTEPDPVTPVHVFGAGDQVDVPVSSVVETPIMPLPRGGTPHATIATASLEPPSAPPRADWVMQTSEAVSFRHRPAWVKFSALPDDELLPERESEPPPASTPEPQLARPPLPMWVVAVFAAAAVVTALFGGWFNAIGFGCATVVLATAQRLGRARFADHRETHRLMVAIEQSPRFLWSRSSRTAAGATLSGEPADARCAGRLGLLLPEGRLTPGVYRIGITMQLAESVNSSRRLSIRQISEAMKDPDLRVDNELSTSFIHHLLRRAPSRVEMVGHEATFSVQVARPGVDDALDDVNMSLIGASILLQWMDGCMSYGEAENT